LACRVKKIVKVKNKDNISEELKELAPAVANIGRNNPYTVPMGYFASFAGEIMNHIKTGEIEPALKTYNVPAGYFDGLAVSILQKIRLQDAKDKTSEVYRELSEIAPLLNTISKANLFQVADGYFEKLETVVIPGEKAPAKVVSLGSNLRKWITYAAAASVLFIVFATSYLYVNMHSGSIEKSPSIEQSIASLNENEIMDYLIDEDITQGDYFPASIEQETEIHNLLKNTSDEEIQGYLNEAEDPGEKNIKGI